MEAWTSRCSCQNLPSLLGLLLRTYNILGAIWLCLERRSVSENKYEIIRYFGIATPSESFAISVRYARFFPRGSSSRKHDDSLSASFLENSPSVRRLFHGRIGTAEYPCMKLSRRGSELCTDLKRRRGIGIVGHVVAELLAT